MHKNFSLTVLLPKTVNSFTTSWTGHVQLRVLSLSVDKTDFKTILLIFLPSYSEEFQQKPGMSGF